MGNVIYIANKMRNVLFKMPTHLAALAWFVLIIEVGIVFVEWINNYVSMIIAEIQLPNKDSVFVQIHISALI